MPPSSWRLMAQPAAPAGTQTLHRQRRRGPRSRWPRRGDTSTGPGRSSRSSMTDRRVPGGGQQPDVIFSGTMPSDRRIVTFTVDLERQAGDEEGREEDRQKALSGASEGDGLALGGVEGLRAAGVSPTANLQRVPSGFDRYLDRAVHFDRSGKLTVNHDVVRATSDLGSERLMRHLQGCCHLRSPVLWLGLLGEAEKRRSREVLESRPELIEGHPGARAQDDRIAELLIVQVVSVGDRPNSRAALEER